MSGTAQSRLHELASHLHGALTERERAGRPKVIGQRDRVAHLHTGRKDRRTVTTRVRSPGERQPKISLADDHISLSWVGDRRYHSEVWDQPGRKMDKDARVHYDLLIFYKASQTPPKAWNEAMQWTGAPLDIDGKTMVSPLDCWQEILLESYVVLTRNTAGADTRLNASGQIAGQPTLDAKILPPPKNLKEALTRVEPNRWFAFPGVLDNNKFRRWPKRHPSRGQVVGWVPGTRDPVSKKKFAEGHCLFRHESDVATAIITKIYPENDEYETNNNWVRRCIKTAILIIVGFSLLFLAGAAGLCLLKNSEDAELANIGCRACEIVNAIKGKIPQGQATRQKETEVALRAADAEADRQKVQLDAQTERINTQSREIERLEALPGGLDAPPCWLDESGTRPEFLYDVTISDEGLRISRTDLPHREADYLLLPVSGVPMNETLSERSFARHFKELYRDSVQKDCRHFVQVYEGHHDQVDRYKAQRDVIEGYFYIYRPDRRRY